MTGGVYLLSYPEHPGQLALSTVGCRGSGAMPRMRPARRHIDSHPRPMPAGHRRGIGWFDGSYDVANTLPTFRPGAG